MEEIASGKTALEQQSEPKAKKSASRLGQPKVAWRSTSSSSSNGHSLPLALEPMYIASAANPGEATFEPNKTGSVLAYSPTLTSSCDAHREGQSAPSSGDRASLKSSLPRQAIPRARRGNRRAFNAGAADSSSSRVDARERVHVLPTLLGGAGGVSLTFRRLIGRIDKGALV